MDELNIARKEKSVKYTRRHFIDIATILKDTHANEDIISKYVLKFKVDNPRFDEKRFRDFIKNK